jgi:hypothetical protein
MMRLHGLAAAALAIALGSPAAAEPRTVRLVHEGVCDAGVLRAALAERLGRDPVSAAAGDTVRVTVAKQAGGVVARIAIDGNERQITASDCERLSETVAVVIAMVISRDAPVAEATPEPVPELEPAPTLHGDVEPPPELPRPVRSLHAVLGIAGSARSTSLSFLGGVGLRRGHWSVDAELQFRPDYVNAGVDSGGIAIGVVALSIAPCIRSNALGACLVASGGFVHGRGDALVGARAATAPFAAVGGRLTWEQQVAPRVALRIHLDIQSVLASTRFFVDEMAVWSTDWLEVWAGFGVVATIP